MITFQAAEQYMMYRKALLFSDTQTASQILQAHEPAEQKQLGRKVRNFDRKVWDREKLKIVEEGNFWKFSDVDAGKIRRWLLETGERELIEASSDDRIWGVGFLPENAEANRSHWGQNLLGIALMGVRKRIREQEAAST
ncbi:MAG: hypothetical protein MMC33_000556 [Icmadophila ericetorum]|nr:hypothetical protein [Icmadophila ericetorum]